MAVSSLISLLAVMLAWASAGAAQRPAPGAETADWIARQVDERDTGKDSRLEMAMTLFEVRDLRQVDGIWTSMALSVANELQRTRTARETRRVRMLGFYDPSDGTAFVRAIAGISLRDNLTLEASGGVFAGEGLGRLGLLATRDFAYLRLKVFY